MIQLASAIAILWIAYHYAYLNNPFHETIQLGKWVTPSTSSFSSKTLQKVVEIARIHPMYQKYPKSAFQWFQDVPILFKEQLYDYTTELQKSPDCIYIPFSINAFVIRFYYSRGCIYINFRRYKWWTIRILYQWIRRKYGTKKKNLFSNDTNRNVMERKCCYDFTWEWSI